jgi:hypothetical protein
MDGIDSRAGPPRAFRHLPWSFARLRLATRADKYLPTVYRFHSNDCLRVAGKKTSTLGRTANLAGSMVVNVIDNAYRDSDEASPGQSHDR